MKKAAFAILFLALCLPAHAEEIYLKDGTVISGTITGSDTGTMKVRTSYGEVSVRMSEVKGIDYVKDGGPVQWPDEKPKTGYAFIETDISTKSFSIGFYEDAAFARAGTFLFMGGSARWWVTPRFGLRGSVGFPVVDYYHSATPSVSIKAMWGFTRERRYTAYVGGGTIITGNSGVLTPGLLGIVGVEFLTPPARNQDYWYSGNKYIEIKEAPMPLSVELGYYLNPLNMAENGVYFTFGFDYYIF